jgi:hypothetical protein
MMMLLAPSLLGAQDTLVVVADGPPAWGSTPGLVEKFRIGVLDGAEEEVFGAVGAVVVTADGTMVIADIQVPALRMFSPEGTYLGDAGREGEGPGEYKSLLGVSSHPEGFAIWDPRNVRVSVFDEAGHYLRSFRVPSGLYTGDPFQVDTAGTFYVRASSWTDPETGEMKGQGWLIIDQNGEVQGTVPLPDADSKGPAFLLSAKEGRLSPFTVRTQAKLSPHGYRVDGRNDAYSLCRPLADGRTQCVERAFTPLTPTRGERTQWERWIRFFEERAGEIFGSLPDRKPAYHDFFIDDDGRFWVRRHVPAVEGPDRMHPLPDRPAFTWREPATFDVITQDGEFLGTVVFPDDTRPRVSRGLNVWATTAGEFGETYVVRYRIETG